MTNQGSRIVVVWSCAVLVCGGRTFGSRPGEARTFFTAMNMLLASTKIGVIIHGAAAGADSLASHWADTMGIEEMPFPADWGKYGRSAGPIRNQEMIDRGMPDIVMAFPGDRGTADMVAKARRANLMVVEVRNCIRPVNRNFACHESTS